MRVPQLYRRVAKELGLSTEQVKGVYKLYWWCIREIMRTLPGLKHYNLSIEEIRKLKSTISVTNLGKFYIKEDKYLKLKELYGNQYENIEENKTNVQQDNHNNGCL